MVDAVAHAFLRSAPQLDGRRIGRDTEFTHVACEVLPPGSQRGLADVEPLALLAHRFHHQMHVRVPLVRVQDHGVSVLEGELLSCRQKLHRRRTLGHGEDEVVHLLGPPVGLSWLGLRPVLASADIEVPDVSEVLVPSLALEHLAVIGMHFELAVAVDVTEMSFDRCRALAWPVLGPIGASCGRLAPRPFQRARRAPTKTNQAR